ncbi:fumarylacetoacetate hydrolase family protein [Salibacterium aidingense]|uniref:fumarylacetoacetate hydrolase family protein n=1 Tax=Salibacterium aidingense TaxID=384933 RepID=UPI0003F5CC35|nr:fumarylacetoacetate hydrolase family protein [Salibacterium aidingense]
MKIIKRKTNNNEAEMAVVMEDQTVYDLGAESWAELIDRAAVEGRQPAEMIQEITAEAAPLSENFDALALLVPIEISEVWAAGVTYQKSREARNYEASDGRPAAETFYDKVYDAPRPELFFKATGARVAAPEQTMYLRSDSDWQIPEPELGLVLNSRAELLGFTIGNDLSSRDIEGENPLYLPQAKVWKRSCSIGPSVRLADTVADPYAFQIICRIFRGKEKVFEGDAYVNQLKRKLEELIDYLKKDNDMFDGTVLLTGTCVVPPNDFTLKDGDVMEIEIPGIGVLRNPVKAL